MAVLRRAVDIWVDHPTVDYVVAVIAASAAAVLVPTGFLTLSETTSAAFFQALAGVGGILVSLGSIVITLLFTVTPNDRLQLVLAAVGGRLRAITVSCLSGLLLATIGLALLILIETGNRTELVWMTVSLTIFAASRFGRLWWLLGRVLAALAQPSTTGPGGSWTAPQVSPDDYQVVERSAGSPATD